MVFVGPADGFDGLRPGVVRRLWLRGPDGRAQAGSRTPARLEERNERLGGGGMVHGG